MNVKLWMMLVSFCFAQTIFTRAPSAAPLADLLEKAIYTEETKGDLPAAIELYKEILSQAKAARSAAANAQFRLASCYLKLGKQSEAIAAFREVIDKFPEEQTLVAKAQEHLPASVSLLPAPWRDGELTELTMQLPSGLNIGRQFLTVHAVERDGRRLWRMLNHNFVTVNGNRGSSRVDADAETMLPLNSRWRHSLLGDATATFEADRVAYRFRNQEAEKTLTYERPVYDNEECLFLMRRLPLGVGYQVTLPVFTSLGSGLIPVELKVTGREPVETPAGKFDCYRLELSVKQTFYFSADEHRYLIKFEAGGVSAEAVRIGAAPLGERQSYRSDAAGVSFQAPPDWLFFGQEEEGEVRIHLLDPEGGAMMRMQIIPPAKIEPGDTIEQWRESDLERGRRAVKDFAQRPDAQITASIGGHPAIGFIIDFADGRNQKVKYNLYAKGATSGLKLTAVMDAAEFAELRQRLDELVTTIQLK